MKIDLRRGDISAPKSPNMEMTARKISEKPEIGAIQPKIPTGSQDTVAPKVMDWIIIGAVYLLAFLMPLFFLPNVPSVLELNKQILLVVLGGVAFLAWIGKLAWEGKIRIKKNFLLVPVIIFLLVMAIGTAFSIYRDQSMWGNFGTEGMSLVSIIALVAVFLVINNNFNTRKKVSYLVMVLIASSFLASIYTIFQIFGKFLFKNPVLAQNSFNSIGSIYAFAVFIGAILILTTAAILEKKPSWMQIVLIVFALVFVFTLIAINFKTSLVIFLVGMAVLLGLSIITTGSEGKNKTLVIPMVILTLILLTTLLGRNGSLIKVQLPVEVGLSQSASADVAKTALKNRSLLGSGLSSYDLQYLKGKPTEINLTNFWSVKFNEAASRFFTLATTTGILGIIAFIFLIGAMLVYIFSTLVKIFGRKDEGIYTLIGITAAWLYLTITLFFYASNITLDFTWWVLTASLVTLAAFVFGKKEEIISETSSPRVSLLLSFVFVVIIVGFISLMFLEGQKYAAAATYNTTLKSDSEGANVEELVGKLNRVTSLDPSRDLYHRNLSVALFAMLNQRVAEKGLQNLSDDDRADISNLYFAAEEQAKAAIALNPQNSENLVQLAQISQNVIGSKDGAEDAAIASYKSALKENPFDPSLYFQIGQVYLSIADLDTAKNASQQAQGGQTKLSDKTKENIALARQNFEKAIELKSNYLPAQFMIANVLQRLGEIDQAIAKLEESRKINPRDVGISFQLGVLYYQTGKYDQARNELETTVKMAENYSNALYFLGLTYDKLNDDKKALEQFQKVVELNPDNADVKQIVDNLESGKKALDGLEKNVAGQNPEGQSSGQSTIQREQEPVPPETPIEPGNQNQPQEEPNPEQ